MVFISTVLKYFYFRGKIKKKKKKNASFLLNIFIKIYILRECYYI